MAEPGEARVVKTPGEMDNGPPAAMGPEGYFILACFSGLHWEAPPAVEQDGRRSTSAMIIAQKGATRIIFIFRCKEKILLKTLAVANISLYSLRLARGQLETCRDQTPRETGAGRLIMILQQLP